jgi:hypothetical protein
MRRRKNSTARSGIKRAILRIFSDSKSKPGRDISSRHPYFYAPYFPRALNREKIVERRGRTRIYESHPGEKIFPNPE